MRKKIKNGAIELECMPTEDMLAEFLTEDLMSGKHYLYTRDLDTMKV